MTSMEGALAAGWGENWRRIAQRRFALIDNEMTADTAAEVIGSKGSLQNVFGFNFNLAFPHGVETTNDTGQNHDFIH